MVGNRECASAMRNKLKKSCIMLGMITLVIPLLFQPSFVRAQVFRGYYPGGTVEVRSNTQDKKKIIKGYYPGGRLEVVYEYENGKLNGTTRQYYENGVLKAEVNYRNDKRNGPAKYYYSSGRLMARLEFKDDMETDTSKYYDENGNLLPSQKK